MRIVQQTASHPTAVAGGTCARAGAVRRARSPSGLLSQARSILQEAKPFAATFVAHELPSNFLGQLLAAVDAFERARGERASSRDQRVAARARFEASMEAALRAVKQLNAIVSNKLNDTAGMLSWNLARRVDYRRVRSSAAATPQQGRPIRCHQRWTRRDLPHEAP